ncbi:hypothetical protein D3C77_583570 [compost metagenome]
MCGFTEDQLVEVFDFLLVFMVTVFFFCDAEWTLAVRVEPKSWHTSPVFQPYQLLYSQEVIGIVELMFGVDRVLTLRT